MSGCLLKKVYTKLADFVVEISEEISSFSKAQETPLSNVTPKKCDEVSHFDRRKYRSSIPSLPSHPAQVYNGNYYTVHVAGE